MKFMLNGAPTLGTMDGANVEIVEEVGYENAFIFGMSSDEVMNYEKNGGYNPYEIYNNDADIRRVVDQLVDGTYADGDDRALPRSVQQSVEYKLQRPRRYVFHSERFSFLRRSTGACRSSIQRQRRMG